MTDTKKAWTNEEILHEFLWLIVSNIYRWASESVDGVREDAADENLNRLKDRLVNLQIGIVGHVFSLIDGSSGPTDWPGIKLVNAETGEPLSGDLDWELSHIEGKYLDVIEPPLEEE